MTATHTTHAVDKKVEGTDYEIEADANGCVSFTKDHGDGRRTWVHVTCDPDPITGVWIVEVTEFDGDIKIGETRLPEVGVEKPNGVKFATEWMRNNPGGLAR